jgi:hypothetical protein
VPGVPIIEHTDPYYTHSGKLTPLGAALSLTAVIVVPVALAILGGAFKLIGTYFIDVGILGVLLTGCFTGILLGKIIKIGKIRNERASFWLGIFAGVLLLLWVWLWFYIFLQTGDIATSAGLPDGVYYPWEEPGRTVRVIHVYAMAEGKRAMSALLPFTVAYLTRFFYFTVEFPYFSGPWLYAFWILEAFLMILWTGVSCKAAAGKHGFVFCEKCNREAKILFKSPLLQPMPAEFGNAIMRFRNRLEEGQFDALESLAVAGSVREPGTFSRLILRGCTKCQNFYCADVAKVEVKWDSEDYRDTDLREVDDEDNLIVEHLLLPAPWYERLRAHFEDSTSSVQNAADEGGGGWLVIIVVAGVMVLAMFAAVVFDL